MPVHILNVSLATPDPAKVAALHTPETSIISHRPPTVDLRAHCPPVYDQGQLGSCTGHASAKGLFEILTSIAGQPYCERSALFAYWNERSAEHTIDQDAGASLCDAAAVLLHEGACPEYLDSYHIDQFRTAPSAAAFNTAKQSKVKTLTHLRSLDAILDCLALG